MAFFTVEWLLLKYVHPLLPILGSNKGFHFLARKVYYVNSKGGAEKVVVSDPEFQPYCRRYLKESSSSSLKSPLANP